MGTTPLNSEWWHYQLYDSIDYPIEENIDYAEIDENEMCLRPSPYDNPPFGNLRLDSADRKYRVTITHSDGDTSSAEVLEIKSGKLYELPLNMRDIKGVCWHPKEAILYLVCSPIYSIGGIYRWSFQSGVDNIERLDSSFARSVFKNYDDYISLELIDMDKQGRRLLLHYSPLNLISSIPGTNFIFDSEKKRFYRCDNCTRANWTNIIVR